MKTPRRQILLTNDDGVDSPGIWTAAEALSALGFVTIMAPNVQYSGAGRGHPLDTDGRIQEETLTIGAQKWLAYAINGSPAQAVMYAILDVMPQKPDLIVSGINYGENIGTDITLSGTVGAALEGAAYDIPSIAISLQITNEDYIGNSHSVDFSTAAWFCTYFAQAVLKKGLPEDTHVLKIDVPASATPETPWRVVRCSPTRYFIPRTSGGRKLDEPGQIRYEMIGMDILHQHPETDAYTIQIAQEVSVAPISLDMTARTPRASVESFLKD